MKSPGLPKPGPNGADRIKYLVPKGLFSYEASRTALKLQRQLARIHNDKEYGKWVVVIPPSLVSELGWQEGERLDALAKGDWLIIFQETRRGRHDEERRTRMEYEEFRDKIRIILEQASDGLTWTEIRNEGGFHQKVPNNKWVSRMEEEIDLLREHERGRGTVWKVGKSNLNR